MSDHAPLRSPETLDFLLARRSRPPKFLTAPGPDREELETLLTAALRVPDHGKLEPWRIVVLGPNSRAELAATARETGPDLGQPEDKVEKGAAQFESPCTVVVIASPHSTDRIPEVEQTLSAGAVCVSLVNAALAAGWGASWLTGWIAHDPRFAAPAYGLADHEWVAGLIHIGTEKAAPPDRPRPDRDAKTEWRP
ncbi:MAG: nitroreductase [Rhodobacterales bacterium]|nr:MAG: nitroreductase [Rhodobacterales bacterium]